jgi:hypothetical protein
MNTELGQTQKLISVSDHLSSNQKSSNAIIFLSFIFCVALIQCLSVWNCQGEKVDESEIFHFSVGFLGGDLDPHWYGYGYIGMALLGIIYWVIGQIYLILGYVNSWVEFASLLFDSNIFLNTGRFVFALIGAATTWCYLKLGQRLGVNKYLLALFVILSVFSVDGLTYANYIRSDQLVNLLCAWILLYLSKPKNSKYDFKLPALIGLAVNCKMSAIALLGLLPFRAIQNSLNKNKFVKQLLLSILVAIFFILAAGPFNNLIATLWKAIDYMALESRVTVTKTAHSGFWEMSSGIMTLVAQKIGSPLVWLLPLMPLLIWRYKWNGAYLVLIFLCLTAPYFITTELTEYWFIPLFSLCRFTAILIVNCLLTTIVPKNFKMNAVIQRVTAATILILYIPHIQTTYSKFFDNSLFKKTNANLSLEWLTPLAQEGKTILFDRYVGHVMPKLYGADINEARSISRAFIYERNKNRFLQEAFALFYNERYLPSFQNSPDVRRASAYDVKDFHKERESRAGAYFVVSPDVANRYVKHNGEGLTPERLREQIYLKNYYLQEMAGEPIKRFDQGTGAVIEVYLLKVTKNPE